MTLPQILGFSVIAAAITTIGSLIALFLKEYIFSRSFERWKNRNSSQQVYEKYREPIILAATELSYRLNDLCRSHPVDFLSSELLELTPSPNRLNLATDPYFRQYRLLSTLYRLCAFLGWLEIYRHEITFLESDKSPKNLRLKVELENLRIDLGDGRINTASNWSEWKDSLIFREEQRAIGEIMIVQSNGVKTIMGYAKFVETMQDLSANFQRRWFDVVMQFFLDPVGTQDFRQVRWQRLVIHLVSLMEMLDSRRVPDDLANYKRHYAALLNI